jgi:methionyl aminopeptidase
MISSKSPREIDLMRRAGEIVALAHQAVAEMIRPGITTKSIDQVVEKLILDNDATPSFKGYGGFPAATCCSVNDTLVHGFPSNYVLKEGDIISVDIGACYKGYHGDSAWTYAVGTISKEAQALMDVTRNSLYEGLKFAKAGNHLTDISHAIGEYVYSFGYSIPYDYSGHGIGSHLHEDPSIPNFGPAGKGILLKEGMTLAIEPMVHRGKPYTKVMDDEWTVKTKDGSLAAHYEHTVVITKDGCDILTTLKGGKNG